MARNDQGLRVLVTAAGLVLPPALAAFVASRLGHDGPWVFRLTLIAALAGWLAIAGWRRRHHLSWAALTGWPVFFAGSCAYTFAGSTFLALLVTIGGLFIAWLNSR